MASPLTVELIEEQIHRFWKALSRKDSQTLRRFYSATATVFSSSGLRYELGPMSAARREREYFQNHSRIEAELGSIHVLLLGDHAESAVASYTFQFRARHIATSDGETEETIPRGRATHVFSYGPDGNLYIMHEHFSLPAEVRSEPLVFRSKLDMIRIPS